MMSPYYPLGAGNTIGKFAADPDDDPMDTNSIIGKAILKARKEAEAAKQTENEVAQKVGNPPQMAIRTSVCPLDPFFNPLGDWDTVMQVIHRRWLPPPVADYEVTHYFMAFGKRPPMIIANITQEFVATLSFGQVKPLIMQGGLEWTQN